MEPTVRSPRIESALASEAALISVMRSTITPWIWFDLVSRKVKGTTVGSEGMGGGEENMLGRVELAIALVEKQP